MRDETAILFVCLERRGGVNESGVENIGKCIEVGMIGVIPWIHGNIAFEKEIYVSGRWRLGV